MAVIKTTPRTPRQLEAQRQFAERARAQSVDITGRRFGRLVVLNEVEGKRWLCRCDCGTEREILGAYLRHGETKSCGCLRAEIVRTRPITHGHTAATNYVNGRRGASPIYRAWRNAKIRCYSTTSTHYAQYGGRGITMCDRWRNSFEAFLADMGPRPEGSSIDRINNDGNYEPGNCRWTTAKQQQRNRSNNKPVTWQGETMLLSEWEERLGLRLGALSARREQGWTVERMFTQPFRRSRAKPQK